MRLFRPRSISLANKCLLLFGGAIAIVLVLALVPPWLRMGTLVSERQLEVSRRLLDTWQRLDAREREAGIVPVPDAQGMVDHAGIRVRVLAGAALERAGEGDPDLLALTGDRLDARWEGATRVYRYVRDAGDVGSERRVLILERQGDDTAVLLIVNTVYLLSAGLAVFMLALVLFYFVTHRLVLSPVQALRETADGVRRGDLSIRSSIRTGDEFEELARVFNQMLSVLQTSQEHERSVNRALDLKLHELSEANSALFESNRVKAEFLANVSHELRTPLNSIIGFAELLLEIAEREKAQGSTSPDVEKRTRFQRNIATAGRHLLQMIESLLEMAKIEAGKVEIRREGVSVRETCEGLIALIQPLADQRDLRLDLDVPADLPTLWTDPKKLHQILFNLLSNAVKFCEPPAGGGAPRVVLSARRLLASSDREPDRIRLTVRDTGPGIPEDQREKIFEKFYQIEGGHARRHAGTGLGLAISRELASLLQGVLTLESTEGAGSAFHLTIPIEPDPIADREIRLERSLRASLASPRDWGIAREPSAPDSVGKVTDTDT